MKGGNSFSRCYCNREWIPVCWRSYGESTFVNIKLSYRNKMLFGNGWSKGRRYIRGNVMLYTCFVCEYVRACVCVVSVQNASWIRQLLWEQETRLGTILKLLLRQTRTVRCIKLTIFQILLWPRLLQTSSWQSRCLFIRKWKLLCMHDLASTTNKVTNQPTNQPTNQSTNQPTNQPIVSLTR